MMSLLWADARRDGGGEPRQAGIPPANGKARLGRSIDSRPPSGQVLFGVKLPVPFGVCMVTHVPLPTSFQAFPW